MIEMDDGVRLRTWTAGVAGGPAVVLLHGGPGLRDYLAPVGALIEDLGLIHRYDQRGTGDSAWPGTHSPARHVRDLRLLLDAWGHERVVLAGHSYGCTLACSFLLACPERVAGLILLAGPFLEPWREAARAAERARLTHGQQVRLAELAAIEPRTEDEETEFLTLTWSTDHADRDRARAWAAASARTVRPVNYAMNAELGAAGRADPLESHVDELRALRPPATVIIGGAGDSRPAAALVRLGRQLACATVIIPDAGHHPWLEAPEQFRSALRTAVASSAEGGAGGGPAGEAVGGVLGAGDGMSACPAGNAVGRSAEGGAGGGPAGEAVGGVLGAGDGMSACPAGSAVGRSAEGGAGGGPAGEAVGGVLGAGDGMSACPAGSAVGRSADGGAGGGPAGEAVGGVLGAGDGVGGEGPAVGGGVGE
ncbi:alpha/beta fold hydrolase [Dactylosporangium sp. CS-047395]|uniref:alpha/beta fold hydrolase n=1 Tax=Dactylosporangium sp. CS-047395 TaxID=3239936 RepID=UPI003D8DBF52